MVCIEIAQLVGPVIQSHNAEEKSHMFVLAFFASFSYKNSVRIRRLRFDMCTLAFASMFSLFNIPKCIKKYVDQNIVNHIKTYSWRVLMTQICVGTSICLNDLLHPLAKHVTKNMSDFLAHWAGSQTGSYWKWHTNTHSEYAMCASERLCPTADSIFKYKAFMDTSMIWLKVWLDLSEQLCSENTRTLSNTNKVTDKQLNLSNQLAKHACTWKLQTMEYRTMKASCSQEKTSGNETRVGTVVLK